ncbi:uncharacterized protein METZ01_LOCUS455740, partial [marine metagenome]
MDLISNIKSHLDKVEKRKIEDKRKIKIGNIKGSFFIELLDKSCDILKAKNDYERTINELRRIYNNQRLEFANREELMRFARIEIYNYDDGGIKIELTDIFHDLDDYDKVHMLCQAIVKTLFDMGDQSFLLTSILYEFHKSIIKKRYKNINRDISFSKIIENVENNYLLYFDIRQHLKINNFYIIDKYSGSNDSIESYQFIFHKQNMNIVTHSYPPIHLSKVLLPINICAL